MLMTYRGVYVDHNERWPEHFRGIGIRIEDSVCVQEDGPLVLTTEAVKEVRDIQLLVMPFTNFSNRLWISRLLGGSRASDMWVFQIFGRKCGAQRLPMEPTTAWRPTLVLSLVVVCSEASDNRKEKTLNIP